MDRTLREKKEGAQDQALRSVTILTGRRGGSIRGLKEVASEEGGEPEKGGYPKLTEVILKEGDCGPLCGELVRNLKKKAVHRNRILLADSLIISGTGESMEI